MVIKDMIAAACFCYGISLVFVSNEFMSRKMLGKLTSLSGWRSDSWLAKEEDSAIYTS